jgi:hypothetical protein
MDEQIAKLEAQLIPLREQIKKARPGPAQDAIKRRALGVRADLPPCHLATLTIVQQGWKLSLYFTYNSHTFPTFNV